MCCNLIIIIQFICCIIKISIDLKAKLLSLSIVLVDINLIFIFFSKGNGLLLYILYGKNSIVLQ